MGNKVVCFWCEPADSAQESLRRFVYSSKVGTLCTARWGYHNASVIVGDVPWAKEHNGEGLMADEKKRLDPLWPKACACGYVFEESDEWQHNFERYYRRADTGALILLREPPAGAMWDAYWMGEGFRGPDGKSLTVVLPDGTPWNVDGPSRNNGVLGPGWKRTGAVPKVTARPSILTPGYHGFLTDGVLESC